MEVTDICMDKEPDHVVYSNSVSNDSNHETIRQYDDLDSRENISGDPEPKLLKENTEVNEFAVKECSAEDSVEISIAFQVEEKEVQDVLSLKCESGLLEEKKKSETENPEDNSKKSETENPKDNSKSGFFLKPATKSIAGNVKTKYTVPQPFALATEKRALCGTRPTGPETDAVTPVRTSSRANSLYTPVSKKQNEVKPATKA